MSRRVPVAFLALLLLLITGLPAAASAAINVRINGALQAFDQPPYMQSGRIMVSIRPIAETLGATVTWNGARQVITMTRAGRVVELQIGSPTARVNGVVVSLDNPAVLVNWRTMASLRFVTEALGVTVRWDEANRTALITTSGALVTDSLKPLERKRLVQEPIHADRNDLAVEGSVRSASYSGGRYIAVEYADRIRLFDLQRGELGAILSMVGRAPTVSSTHAAWTECAEPTGCQWRLKLYEIASGNLRDITPTGYRTGGPMFSSNGEWLAFLGLQSGTADLFVYNVATREQVRVAATGIMLGDSETAYTWAGESILFPGTRPGSVIQYNVRTRQSTSLTAAAFPGLRSTEQWGHVRGSGNWVVYESSNGVYLKNLLSGEHRQILNETPPSGWACTKVFFPDIDGDWVGWINRGEFYSYHIPTKRTVQLTRYNRPDPVIEQGCNAVDKRLSLRRIDVQGQFGILYNFGIPLEAIRLPD